MSPKTSEIPIGIRAQIITLHELGFSYRKIAEKVGYTFSAVRYVIKRFQKKETIENEARVGRPRKVDERLRRVIIRQATKEPFASAPQLASEIADRTGIVLGRQTVRNVLYSADLHGRSPRKKSFISEINRQKWLAFAREYIQKPATFWHSVIFSDESKFNLFGSDGKRYVWRKRNTELETNHVRVTVKHGGGNRMVWGCMAASGVGNRVFIDGIMRAPDYIEILRSNLKESACKLGLERSFVFQQDNDPKHNAMQTREWLLYHAPSRLLTPPQSPDLNVIENLWSILDAGVRTRKISNAQDLQAALEAAWADISPNLTRHLVDSMPRRLQAVIEANGMHTKY